MATGFNQILQSMAQADFFTGILPFLLSYILFFLALQKVPIMDEASSKKKFSSLLAIIFAFFVSRFIVMNPLYQQFFIGYFGRIAIGLVGIIGLMIFLGMIGVNFDGKEVPLVVILVVAGATGAFMLSNGIYAFLPNQELIFGLTWRGMADFIVESGVLYLLILGGGIYYATVDSDRDEDEKRLESMFKALLGQ